MIFMLSIYAILSVIRLAYTQERVAIAADISADDSLIIVMDYIEGNNLDKILSEFGAQSQENVVNWALQLCDVLGYLHTRKPPII